jgi:ADP-heptose:LPS heptosyltransferase
LDQLAGAVREPGRLTDRMKVLDGELSRFHQSSFDRIVNLNTSRLAALVAELIHADERDGPGLAPNRRDLVPAPWAWLIMRLMRNRRLIRFNLVDLLVNYARPDRPPSGLAYRPPPQGAVEADRLLAPADGGPLIGFQVGSRHHSRQWPPEYFAALADRLDRRPGARAVLLGVESERPLGRAVIDRLAEVNPGAAGRVIDLMGRTGLAGLAAVLTRLAGLVTTDTGTMHLAAAVGTPTLALFMGPAWCHETGPYGAGHLVLQARPDCAPCLEGGGCDSDYACRRLIDPDTAHRAVTNLLGSEPDRPIPTPTGVAGLIARMDGFGAVYLPVDRPPLDRTEALALACRRAGRRYMRPWLHDYADDDAEALARFGRPTFDPAALIAEIRAAAQGRPPAPDLEPLADAAARMRSQGDTEAARRFIDDAAAVVAAADGTTGVYRKVKKKYNETKDNPAP